MKTLVLSVALFVTCHLQAVLVVVNLPGNMVSPEATVVVTQDVISFPGNEIVNYGFTLNPSQSYSGRMGGTYFFRDTDTPDVGSVTDTTTFSFYQTQEAGPDSYSSGAQAGDDNWIYITNLADENAWAQVNINAGVITPIKYVYDSVDRTAPITLPDAVSAVPEPSTYALLLSALALVAVLRRRKA
jgi:hypothetical protein